MRRLWQLMGRDTSELDLLSAVHVAGSKGKGSTCTFTESILRKAGMKTGLFTSPHVLDICERIRVNGVPISKEHFVDAFYNVYDRLESYKDELTFFRLLTLMSFDVFLRERVDVAIVEVGIGGRYDCTNIIDNPAVCGITSIEAEHQDLLGDSIQSIAWHKGGIIKARSDLFVSRDLDETAHRQIDCISIHVRGARATVASKSVDAFKLGICGSKQAFNASLGLDLASAWYQRRFSGQTIPHEAVVDGLAQARLLGRHQIVSFPTGLRLFLDGAHTQSSIEDTSSWFHANADAPYKVLVFYTGGDRDYKGFLTALGLFDEIVITEPACLPLLCGSSKSVQISEYAARTSGRVHNLPIRQAVAYISALRECAALVTGSFYLVGDVLKYSSNLLATE